MKKKVLKSIGILALAAFVGLQGSAGTVWAAEAAVAGDWEVVPGAADGEEQILKSMTSVMDGSGEAGADQSEDGVGTSGAVSESGESGSDITGSGNGVSGGESGEPISGITGSGNNVSGSESGEPAPDSGQTGSETPAEKTKLATPEISWDGWSLTWHDVAGSEGFYGVEIATKKAGSEEWERVSYPPTNDFSADGSGICRETDVIAHNLGVRNSRVPGFGGDDDNTVVRFRVRALGRNEALYEAGEWSDWCEKVYSRPAQELKVPECRWDEATSGLLHWTPVDGAMGYVVVAYNEAGNQSAYARCGAECQEYDFSQSIANWRVGKYYVHVRALSSDIDVCANGDSGEIVYEVPSAAVGDVLSEAMDVAQTDPRSAVGILMQKADMTELANAMQTDPNVLNQVKELERLYMEVSGITVASPTVTEAAGAMLDASKINVAGAGFNGWNNAVALQVDVVESGSAVEVPDTYVRSVQLDIRLLAGERAVTRPNLPVTITIPVPSGIDAGKLAIIHYGADGQGENVSFRNNGDGTVMFTVTHFSVFLFGEKRESDGNDGNNGGNTQGTPDNSQNGANAQNTLASPQTGQEFSAAELLVALCGVAGVLAFGLGYFRRHASVSALSAESESAEGGSSGLV